jgi:hypothetical protein
MLDIENYFSLMFTAFGFCLALGFYELILYIGKKMKSRASSMQNSIILGAILTLTVLYLIWL